MEKNIRHILVVGGGTAGWLSASLLARHLNSKFDQAVQVSLVESPTIPVLGVGEGTWPTMRATLQTLGIDEGDFMRECHATFKQGSEFVNWASTPKPGGKNGYYHPFSAVFHSAYDFNLAPYWLLKKKQQASAGYDMATATQAHICNQGLAPKKITTASYAAIQNYSYHLDADKFATFLHEQAVNNLGVNYISANVTDVNLDEQGYIESVDTDSAGRLVADFFVDCSGARGLLIEDAMGIGWKPMKSVIFNNAALAMQVPYPAKDTPIATHTIATAQESGWTWDIGLH